jgi:hypothetical protein
MVSYLYFDIETAPEFKSREEYLSLKKKIELGQLTEKTDRALYYRVTKGATNPHEGKVISIAYALNDEKLQILKEWKSSEPAILQEFYNLADKASREGWQSHKPLTYVGFGILDFDIPFMFCRMQNHKTATSFQGGHDPIWLFRRLFQVSADLRQMHLHLNDCDANGLTHDALCSAYGLRTKDMEGKMLTDLYYNEKYEKIEDYIQREFVYPQLFKKIMNDGLVHKTRLRSSVRSVLEKRRAEKS